MKRNYKYGWKKDSPDLRDYIFKASLPMIGDYYPVDLRADCPPVLNQLNLASCTAFATTTMVQFVRNKQKLDNWQPSPLFTYYTTRQLENTTATDSGAQVRNALKSAVNYGVVQENLWAYNPNKAFKQPDESIYSEGLKHQTLEYHRIADGFINYMRHCLYEGYPFTFGLMLYDSFNSDETIKSGLVKKPDFENERILGGHCMLCVGWKMINNEIHFIVQNSWGTKWGDNGYCYIPESYMHNKYNAFDFWTIRLEEDDQPPIVEPEVVAPEVTPVVEPVVKPVIKKKKSILNRLKDVFRFIKDFFLIG
jgi:C1A family cysteine protease